MKRDSSEESKDLSSATNLEERNRYEKVEQNKRPISRRRDYKNSRNSHSGVDVDLLKKEVTHSQRFPEQKSSSVKPMNSESDLSDDSEETDEDDIRATKVRPIERYDPKEYEHLDVSTEIKELFQNIQRYTPQKIELQYKLIPFIPDYIPAVGDVDTFLKIPRPDGVPDKLGLEVLDEPCLDQSDPVILHLQLRSQSKTANVIESSVVKRIEDVEKQGKAIDKWIEDISHLHRRRLPTVQLTNKFPDIDTLLQHWPPELERKLNDCQINIAKLDCGISSIVDLVCNLMDIPVYKNSRLESLHILFSLFLDMRNSRNDQYDRVF